MMGLRPVGVGTQMECDKANPLRTGTAEGWESVKADCRDGRAGGSADHQDLNSIPRALSELQSLSFKEHAARAILLAILGL